MADAPRDSLTARREGLLHTLAALQADHAAMVAASEGSNADDEHDPEGATIAFERSQVAALVQQARSEIVEVDAALERAGSAGYGVCERCGEGIGAERLAVRPATRRCVQCASLR